MLSIGKQLTAEQRLSKAVVDIMANPKYVALAGILMIGDRGIKEDIPTACTNGRDEWYGRGFVDRINDAELRFVILHESYHKLYKHLTTWRWMYDENPRVANMACDYVINLKIADDNKDGWATMPEGGLLEPLYRDMDSAQVYRHILQSGDGGDSGDSGEGSQGNESTGDSSSQPGSSTPGTGSGSQPDKSPQGFDDHDWEGAGELTADEQRDLARDIDEAIRQGALVAGKLGSGDTESFGELLKVQVDWREVLREFITSTCTGSDYSTWKRPNRRYVAGGYHMPSGISESVDSLHISGDASGSNIGQREQSVILTEASTAVATVKPDVVHMTYWDTKITRHEKYEGDEILKFAESTRPTGGGGTDVVCVPKFLQEQGIKPQASVVITDGYLGGDWGTWGHPVLWVIIDNPKCKPPFGKFVHVKSRDL